MRLFAFLLLLYFTALSLVPCTDGMQQSSSHIGVEDSFTEHDHNDSEHQDDCTPFCTCACCGSIVTLPPAQSILETKIETSADYLFHYALDYSFDYCEGIWHPPSFS
jgi:hypothetical protein